jgi:hypothetical protein
MKPPLDTSPVKTFETMLPGIRNTVLYSRPDLLSDDPKNFLAGAERALKMDDSAWPKEPEAFLDAVERGTLITPEWAARRGHLLDRFFDLVARIVAEGYWGEYDSLIVAGLGVFHYGLRDAVREVERRVLERMAAS